MTDNTDHALDPGQPWLDDMLRGALNRLPDQDDATEDPPTSLLEEIDRAIDAGWLGGHPPTLDELTADHDDLPVHDQGWSDTDGHTFLDGHNGAEQGFHPHPAHDWHHHDNHSTDIDPDPGAHL